MELCHNSLCFFKNNLGISDSRVWDWEVRNIKPLLNIKAGHVVLLSYEILFKILSHIMRRCSQRRKILLRMTEPCKNVLWQFLIGSLKLKE